jgi:hypothetical protein
MTSFVSITDVLRSQVEPYQHLAWFLYEAAEREHRLNLEALSRAPGELVDPLVRLPVRAAGSRRTCPLGGPRRDAASGALREVERGIAVGRAHRTDQRAAARWMQEMPQNAPTVRLGEGDGGVRADHRVP